MLATPKDVAQTCFLLQSDTRDVRMSAFQGVKAELRGALMAGCLGTLEMMQLWKAMWLVLYKEDNDERQDEIARKTAELIYECPTLIEFMQSYGLDEDGNPLQAGEECAEGEEEEEANEQDQKQLEEFEEEEFEEFEEGFEEEYEEQDEPQEKIPEGKRPVPEQEDEFAFIDKIADGKGPATMFFTCGLETFLREWGRVDFHRQSKFQRLIRYTVYHGILSAIKRDELLATLERVDQLIFNYNALRQLQTPQSLIMHVVGLWNDMLRFMATEYKEFDAGTLRVLLLPIVSFYKGLDVTEYPQLADAIIEDIFNDLTDTNYARDEALARFLLPSLSDEQLETADACDFPVQDVIAALAVQEDVPQANREKLLELAEQIEDYVAFFPTKEYDDALKLVTNDDGQIMRLAELQELEDNYIISRDAVKLAKRRHGKAWNQHVFKQDGIVHYTKANVKVQRYEDDYLPKKYRHLEAAQRDVGEWDDIDDDGNSIRDEKVQ